MGEKYGEEARLELERKMAKEKAEGQGPGW